MVLNKKEKKMKRAENVLKSNSFLKLKTFYFSLMIFSSHNDQ